MAKVLNTTIFAANHAYYNKINLSVSLRPKSQIQLAPRFGISDISPKNIFFREKEERGSPDEKTQSVFEQGAVVDDAATGTFA